jgi:N-acetylmuramic acid 6-phosphate etherase
LKRLEARDTGAHVAGDSSSGQPSKARQDSYQGIAFADRQQCESRRFSGGEQLRRTRKTKRISERSPKELGHLPTEQPNIAARNLDQKSSLEIVQIINAQDAKVAAAVKAALPQIACAIDLIAKALKQGGRLIYVGAGTSGRLGALDASECPPTFNVDPRTVQFIIAGGIKALHSATEASEDSSRLGQREMAKKEPGKHDVVVGIAASGRTPFTIAAVEFARRHGAKTIAVTCNAGSPLEEAVHLAIVAEVGPEVIAGSSRMKAGSAQKMILNMLSSGAMTRMGYVYGNLMINVHVKNYKLHERGLTILQQAAGIGREAAEQALQAAGSDVPVALVMLQANVNRQQATQALKESRGHVRQAINAARSL